MNQTLPPNEIIVVDNAPSDSATRSRYHSFFACGGVAGEALPITRRHVGLFREIGDILNVKISGRSAFPYAAGEDRELCDRWLHHGYGMIFAPEVVVRHSHFLRFQTFCKQHFNYGRPASYFHKVRAERGQKRIKVEPLRFYLDLLRYPFMHLQAGRPKLLAILLLISQAVNTAGFCRDALSRPAKRSMPVA